MQILHISDTHGCHKSLTNLPKADIIIHSGDASFSGSDEEILDFLNWFCDLDYAHKIFVAGNHDDCLYGEQIEGLPDNCHYLCYSGIEIEGLKFWGVPLFMGDILKKGRMEEIMKEIPNDTNILISHNPPFGILDFDDGMNYGCRMLLEAVERVNPFYHFFGHIHAANGIETINKTTFVNSAIMNGKYEFVNKPRLFVTDEPQNERLMRAIEKFKDRTGLKEGAKVRYVGASEEQVKFWNGRYFDPRKILDIESIYEIESVEVSRSTTKVKLVGYEESFCGIIFEKAITEQL